MTRNMDLIRELLLKLESLPLSATSIYLLNLGDADLQIEGYSDEQIGYHFSLIEEAGLIENGNQTCLSGGFLFSRLSWAGHDFLDAIRDPQIWAKTRKGAEAAGGFTVDLLKDLAKGFIKKQIEEYTGVKV